MPTIVLKPNRRAVLQFMSTSNYQQCPSASLLKQIAAMVYDSLLILALLFLATAVALVFNQGEAIESSPAFSLYLLLILFSFYAWFWHKSGQTLGMRTWKIRIVAESGGNPAWGACYLRLCFALLSIICFGVGYLWRLFSPYTWHDRLSRTRIVDVSALTHGEQHTDPGAV